ncbi:MAG: DUF4269 domain-containing protein [Bacteroidota bacterium]
MASATPDFTRLDYLANGSATQKMAYQAINASNVFQILAPFGPLLAGTLPLDLFTPHSDLDVLCHAPAPDAFATFVEKHFSSYSGFSVSEKKVHHMATVIARFRCHGYLFEIFGQPVPPREQVAYRHLLAEHALLQQHGENLKQTVLALKLKGMKTEPAFAQALGLPGDPYETLLLLSDQLANASNR